MGKTGEGRWTAGKPGDIINLSGSCLYSVEDCYSSECKK
jgi:hypothetical protein